jgi:hypothetical protein
MPSPACAGLTALCCVSLRPLEPSIVNVITLRADLIPRGQGPGLRLVRAIEARSRDMWLTHARLDSNTHFTVAVTLYRNDSWVETASYTSPPANVWLAKRV